MRLPTSGTQTKLIHIYRTHRRRYRDDDCKIIITIKLFSERHTCVVLLLLYVYSVHTDLCSVPSSHCLHIWAYIWHNIGIYIQPIHKVLVYIYKRARGREIPAAARPGISFTCVVFPKKILMPENVFVYRYIIILYMYI